MNIIIAGSGEVGFHLAQLLSYEQHSITIIDLDEEVLDFAETHLDVITINGDCTSPAILELAEIKKADLFLGVTTSEETNLISSILAKKLGCKQTIARVNNPEYLSSAHKNIFEELGIDSLISPRSLAANEIRRLVERTSVTDMFDFEDGKFTVFGITIDLDSSVDGRTLDEIVRQDPNIEFRALAVLRGNKTLLPRGSTVLKGNDHLFFVAHKRIIDRVAHLLGKSTKRIKRIMIAGGSPLSYLSAKMLEKDFNITILEKDKDRCKVLADKLNNTLILHGDPHNIDLLKEEGLEDMDAFIALTPDTETNVLMSVLAKNMGVRRTIALVENNEYTHISHSVGVDTIINKKHIAANNIFRYVRKGKIEAIASLHGVDAEIIEFVVHKNNVLTRKPLRKIHFPEDAIIGGIIRNDESIIPAGDFILEKGDKVIIFALPRAIRKLEKLFR
jgi:trk system potassium uptake protein TrkA